MPVLSLAVTEVIVSPIPPLRTSIDNSWLHLRLLRRTEQDWVSTAVKPWPLFSELLQNFKQ